MQQPTCTNVRIRSTQDAHKIFFAIQQDLLRMVTRRLDAEERLALKTGCAYAWEERGPHTEVTGLGIERFTEGRRWSPSRVRDEFLFYYEKYCPTLDIGRGATDKQQSRDWDPLVKQTYSVWIETDKGRRKWHLTAYFTQATVDELGTIDDIPGMQDLVVPSGLFKSTRVGKSRQRGDEQTARATETSPKASTTVTRTYAPFPSLYNHYPPQSKASDSVTMYEPYENTNHSGYSYEHSPRNSPASALPDRERNSLPPIQGYSGTTHAVTASSPVLTYPPINNVRQTSVQATTTQGPSNSTTSSISAHPTSHQPPLHQQSTATYSIPAQSHRSPSPAVLSVPHVDDTYPDRLPGDAYIDRSSSALYLPAESPPIYTDRPMHSPSTTYAYPAVGTVAEIVALDPPTRHYPSIDSGSLYRQEIQIPGSQPGSPSCALPPLRIDLLPPSYELSPAVDPSEGRRGSIGPDRDLAPIYALTRPHPYRRDPLDDKTLRLLTPRSS